ncbi:MAG: SDR family NAD(P)-dependent oxidoreductase [Acidimicrobiales bacterium]
MRRACEGRVAIVTGASRGIGEAIARRLALEGARVAVVARTLGPEDGSGAPGSLQETVAAIADAGGEAVAVRADLSKQEDRRRLVAEAEERLGPVDILVNNAAVTFFADVEGFAEKRWKLMMEVQVRAPFELAQLVLGGMRARRRGWILNISSRAAIHPFGPPFDAIHRGGGMTVYGMCKAALERFSTGLAAEVYEDGVVVNALAPWEVVPTPGAGFHDLVKGSVEAPEVIAEAAMLLCSCDRRLTGRVAYSQQLLAELKQRPVTPPLRVSAPG